MSKKIIGILGGMGPAATADLFTKIINSTDASCDQEHLHVIIDSNTNIPDRTEALIHGGADPTEQMTQSARRLVEAGAELIVMPCNTAHGFYDAVCASVPVPVLHMIKLTAQELMRHEITRAGLLATDGTVQSGIYELCFAGSGIELITPSPEAQAAVMDLTYNGVKAGRRDFDTSGFLKKQSASFSTRACRRSSSAARSCPRHLICTALITNTSTPPLCLRARQSLPPAASCARHKNHLPRLFPWEAFCHSPDDGIVISRS